MKLTLLGIDCGKTGCPAVFTTDRDTIVVQGWRVEDPDALDKLRELGMADTETAVEIPRDLLKQFPPAPRNVDA